MIGRASVIAIALCATAQAHAGVIVIEGARVHVAPGRTLDGATVVIRDGVIVEVGAGAAVPEGAQRIDAAGAVVTAGFVDGYSQLGLVEVDQEGSTVDGRFGGDNGGIHAAYTATDGYNPRSVAIPVARTGGVTSAVSAPTGGLVSGASAWVTLADATDVAAVAVRAPLAMHVTLGADAMGVARGSRGVALERLRELLDDVAQYAKRKAAYERAETRPFAAARLDLEALLPVLAGRVPLVVRCDRASDILAAVRLGAQLRVRVIIAGGAEAWTVAEELAASRVPVILAPTHNLPADFDAVHVRDDAAAVLRAAGVTVVISTMGEPAGMRTLRQEAGVAVGWGLSWDDALAAVTTAPAAVFGITDRGTVEKGKVADLVVWSGDPFELSSRPLHVLIGGQPQPLRTRQTLLLERYR